MIWRGAISFGKIKSMKNTAETQIWRIQIKIKRSENIVWFISNCIETSYKNMIKNVYLTISSFLCYKPISKASQKVIYNHFINFKIIDPQHFYLYLLYHQIVVEHIVVETIYMK